MIICFKLTFMMIVIMIMIEVVDFCDNMMVGFLTI